jgi:lysozyme
MKTLSPLIFILLLAELTASTSQFNQPWNDTSNALLIDPYENNKIDWALLAKDPRVVAIIHRATTGLRQDSEYRSRKAIAKTRGYLWGSYHIGEPGDPIKQADVYLATIGACGGDVIALDIESLDPTRSITIADAIRFVERIHERTGRYPLIYANDDVTKALTKQYAGSTSLVGTGLWYARFRNNIPNFPTGVWSTYTFWQFSSEINCKRDAAESCLYRVSGTDTDMDVDVFYGSAHDLRAMWPNVARESSQLTSP